VAPVYEGDRKKRVRSYYVQGEIVLGELDVQQLLGVAQLQTLHLGTETVEVSAESWRDGKTAYAPPPPPPQPQKLTLRATVQCAYQIQS